MSRKHHPNSVTPIETPQTTQSQASVWLAKLDGSNPSDELLLEFKRWINEDKSHYVAFKKVAAAWDDLNILTRLPLLMEARAQQNTQSALKAEQARKSRLPLGLNWALTRLGGFGVAATLVFGVSISLQLGLFKTVPTVYQTAVGERKTITLPDNSVAQLNTNSRIQVDYTDGVRAIHLHQGEVHFDVESNALRPFEVYAGTGRVRAVGTAFVVRVNHSDIGVIVTEGVVEIAPEMRPPSGPVLESPKSDPSVSAIVEDSPQLVGLKRVEAGSAALFDQEAVTLIELLDKEELQRSLAWQQGLLIFSGEPLEEVVNQLSRYTDLKIVIKSERARLVRIGGQFQIGDTQAVFSALEKGFGLKANYITQSLVYLSYPE